MAPVAVQGDARLALHVEIDVKAEKGPPEQRKWLAWKAK